MPEFDPDDLIGRTFLLPPQENGERLRAKVTKIVVEEIEAADGKRLCIAAQDPKEIINILKTKHKLKVKGDGPSTYHLGADYYQDPDGTMVSQPKKYIEKLKETYIRLFNTEPSKGLKTPLRKCSS